MSDPQQQKLFGLLEVTEKTLAELQVAIVSMKTESDRLGRTGQDVVAQIENRSAGAIQEGLNAVDARLRAAAKWFAWRWVALATAVIVAASLAGALSVWWQQRELAQLRQDRAVLQQEVDRLAEKMAVLDNKGARVRWNTCDGRLCFAVADKQGKGIKLQGAWESSTGEQWVVPKGY